jgi:hypothetical protein
VFTKNGKYIWKWPVILSFVFFLLLSCSSGPAVRHYDGENFRSWNSDKGASHSIQIVNNPTNSANQVVRFEVRSGDQFWWDRRYQKHAERAELSEYGYYNAPFGKDMWYSFRTFISPEWPMSPVRYLIAQWHASPDMGEVLRGPPLGIEYNAGDFYIRIYHSSKRRMTETIPASALYRSDEYSKKGVWHDFLINVKWTYKKDGYLNVWIDRNRVIKYRGPIGYNDRKGLYFKMGIYRDRSPDTFVLYHDDYRRGFSSDDIGVENPFSFEKLRKDVDNKNYNVRVFAIEDLNEIGFETSQVVPVFNKALDDTHKDVRYAAASALSQIGRDGITAVPKLIKCLNDNDKYVRRAATKALGNIKPIYNEEVRSALIKALDDDYFQVRVAAIRAIANCGFATNDVKEALNKASLEDNDRDVKAEAIKALNKLTLK